MCFICVLNSFRKKSLLKQKKHLNIYIGSGKFVPMLKEIWNAENLNFSIHLLNYIG